MDAVGGHGLPAGAGRGHVLLHPRGGPVHLPAPLVPRQRLAGLHAPAGAHPPGHPAGLPQAHLLRPRPAEDEACAVRAGRQPELDLPRPRGQRAGGRQLAGGLRPGPHAAHPAGHPAERQRGGAAAAPGAGRVQDGEADKQDVLRRHLLLPGPVGALPGGVLLEGLRPGPGGARRVPDRRRLDEFRPGGGQPIHLHLLQQGVEALLQRHPALLQEVQVA